MRTTGAILLVFGIFVLIKPELIAYIVAFICIALGTQLIIASGLFGKTGQGGVKFGDYEILRRKK